METLRNKHTYAAGMVLSLAGMIFGPGPREARGQFVSPEAGAVNVERVNEKPAPRHSQIVIELLATNTAEQLRDILRKSPDLRIAFACQGEDKLKDGKWYKSDSVIVSLERMKTPVKQAVVEYPSSGFTDKLSELTKKDSDMRVVSVLRGQESTSSVRVGKMTVNSGHSTSFIVILEKDG